MDELEKAREEVEAHWYRLSTGTSEEGEGIATSDCAFCRLFRYSYEGTCSDCPISNVTMKSLCDGTPYENVEKIVRLLIDDVTLSAIKNTTEFKEASAVFYRWLKNLNSGKILPTEVVLKGKAYPIPYIAKWLTVDDYGYVYVWYKKPKEEVDYSDEYYEVDGAVVPHSWRGHTFKLEG
jgi:hypothetical protein